MKYTARSSFWAKVNIDNVHLCWEWQAYRNAKGYGVAADGGKIKLAHRVSYTKVRGEIPDGLTIDHLCKNTSCVNPFHMEVVTVSENNRRRNTGRRKLYCKRGHPRTQDNLNDFNDCIQCRPIRSKEYYRRTKNG